MDPFWPMESAYGYANANPVALVDVLGTFPGKAGPLPSLGYCLLQTDMRGYNCCVKAEFVIGFPSNIELCPRTKDTPECKSCAKQYGLPLDKFCSALTNWMRKRPEPISLNDVRCIGRENGAARDEALRRCKHVKVRQDMCVHCMTACLLTKACGKRAAAFAAWCREMRQLASCLPSGGEEGDDRANNVGIGAAPKCAEGCREFGAK